MNRVRENARSRNSHITPPTKRSKGAAACETMGVFITASRVLVLILFLTMSLQNPVFENIEHNYGVNQRTIFQSYIVSYTVSTMATFGNVMFLIERQDAAYNDPKLELLSYHLAGVGFSMVSQIFAAALYFMQGCSGKVCDVYWNILTFFIYLLVDTCLYVLLYHKRKSIISGRAARSEIPVDI